MNESPSGPAARRALARRLAEPRGGVVSRAILRRHGIDRNAVRREVAAERWRLLGTQTVAVHRGALEPRALRWRATWEIGERIALLDGVSALVDAGVTGLDEPIVHVSVPHTARIRPVDGVRVHKVARGMRPATGSGPPRTGVAVAAVRAAHWSVSDRQAAFVMCLPVQQRLCTGSQLLDAVSHTRGRTRRAFVLRIAHDIADGAHGLGELDVVEACMRRGLPRPSRQVVRRTSLGRAYLDIGWEEARLAVEVDGAGHAAGLEGLRDSLRQNAVQLESDELVLRVDLLGWRLDREPYLRQICTASWSRVHRAA